MEACAGSSVSVFVDHSVHAIIERREVLGRQWIVLAVRGQQVQNIHSHIRRVPFHRLAGMVERSRQMA